MAKLKGNTVVVDENGASVSLLAGEDLPSWAAAQVGDHLVEGGEDAEPTPYREQKMADLKAEIDRRNEGRSDEDKIDPEGRASIESYAAALDADDAKSADGNGGSES